MRNPIGNDKYTLATIPAEDLVLICMPCGELRLTKKEAEMLGRALVHIGKDEIVALRRLVTECGE